MIVAEVFADRLKREGIEFIFGYPGGATVELAEYAHRQGIRFIAPKTEFAAGHMANAYGMLTGRPGVLLTTLGPGAANAVNPTASALLDRAPLLTVTGRQGLSSNLAHQRFNQVSMFEPVTKWSETVNARAFGWQLDKAFRIALAERPGSVHLDMPADQPAAETPAVPLPQAPRPKPAGPDEAAVEAAIGALRAARRPLVLAGYGAARHNAGGALQEFCEAWGIAFLTTAKAKGVISEQHPLWAGVLDMAAPRFIADFAAKADLLLAVGFDPVEMINRMDFRAPVIHVDGLPNTDGVYVSEIEVVGDIASSASALAQSASGQAKWSEGEIREHREAYVRHATRPSSRLTPSDVAFAAREVLPDESIVLSDVGSHKMLLGSLWSTRRPKTFLQSNGLGTMGFSLPGAIAAKLMNPGVPVAALTGDGGFAMVASELGTAVDLGAPVIVVVFNDCSLDRIVRKQVQQSYQPLGTTFSNPDFVKLAEAYGACGASVDSADGLQKALSAALSVTDRPTVIDARIDPAEYLVQFEG